MKLRNKKTGEIGELLVGTEGMTVKTKDDFDIGYNLKTLAEEWEDYDESEEYYYISDIGCILKTTFDKKYKPDVFRKSIGNYFATEEDAEKAIKKLKNKVYKSEKYPTLNWDCATQSFVDYER